MAKFDLNPNSGLKKSIQKFIAMAYDSPFIEGNGSLNETPKTSANNITSCNSANKLEDIPEAVECSLPSCSIDSSLSIIKNDLADDDTDIEILEIEENSNVCEQDGGQNNNHLKLKQESKRGCVQTDLKEVSDQNEVLNEDASIDLRHIIRDTSDTSNQQVPMSFILSKLQPTSYSNICLIKEGNGEKLKQKEQLKNYFTTNVKSLAIPDCNKLQILKSSDNAETVGPASVNKADSNESSTFSHNLLRDHEWSKKDAKLLDVGLEQNEEELLNKKDISIQNDASTPATIIPSIPIAHGFKRYRSYTSAEHLAYLHELALSRLSELKVPTDSDSCMSSSTPQAEFTENEATSNCSKREACSEIETATVTVTVTPEDTHYKTDSQNSSSENWISQGRRNNSLSGCHGMIAPRVSIAPSNEENTNIYTGYNISKMRSFTVHSLPKSNDNVPISPLPPPQMPPPPPPPPPQLTPSSSSSLSLSSSFSISHSIPPKHVTTTDGQEWIMKLPENRKPMESLWPAYRPVYQPYTVYDSRFMQQRVQISQRPVMIVQPQSSMNPCLEQSHGCVNQYRGRFWGIYSPIAHRYFPRQAAQAAQQQRMSAANPDIVPRFISHPTQRISTNHPVYISQLSKIATDIPQYTTHLAESKCKSLEEIVGRIKENSKQ